MSKNSVTNVNILKVAGRIEMKDTPINNLKNPEQDKDAVNKAYVDKIALNQPVLNGNILTLKFSGANGQEQSKQVDLSSLVTVDTHISNAVYDAASNIITLSTNDNKTYSINLSEFSILTSTDANGETTLMQEGVEKIKLSKVAITGEYADLKNKPDASNANQLDAFNKTVINVADAVAATDAVNKQYAELNFHMKNGAGLNNTGYNQAAFGNSAGMNNTGDTQVAVGDNAGLNNTGDTQSTFGNMAGVNNTGANQIAVGNFAGVNNTGHNQAAFGNSAGMNNTGIYQVAVGDNAGVNNQSNNYSQFGSQTANFREDISTRKVFNTTSVDAVNKTITIQNHGFGAAGTTVRLHYAENGNAVLGLEDDILYDFIVVDDNTLKNDRIKGFGNGECSLTKNYNTENSTALGFDAYAKKPNQVVLGNGEVAEVSSYGNYVSEGNGNGLILKTPDGTKKYKISVDNSGAIITTLIP